jgi:hypothetical protein
MTKIKLLKFGKIDDLNTAKKFFTQLTSTNDKMYNKTKLLEELAELNEKVLKSINKHPDHKPSQNEIIEEIGDVFIRLMMYSVSEGISDEQIQKRVIEKSNKFIGYITQGIYDNL